MGGPSATCQFLRNAAICIGVFLTCSLPVPDLSTTAYAFDYYQDSNTGYVTPDQWIAAPFEQSDHDRQMTMLGDYVHKQVPAWLPGLPAIIRSPSRWMQNRLGLSGWDDSDPSSGSSFFQPLTNLMTAPAPEAAEGMWFSPDYHHKGFLPLNDAMIMGVNLRQRAMDDRLQFDVHPYYGQNWHNADGYWGTEIGMSLRDAEQHTWGRIAVRYNNGDNNLMDEQRGFDMHSEINFDEHLGLNAGVRGSDNSDLGNYILLRWKLNQ